jgi:hypothetical protein
MSPLLCPKIHLSACCRCWFRYAKEYEYLANGCHVVNQLEKLREQAMEHIRNQIRTMYEHLQVRNGARAEVPFGRESRGPRALKRECCGDRRMPGLWHNRSIGRFNFRFRSRPEAGLGATLELSDGR